MKVVLVFPPFYLESLYNLAPLGLINAATALESLPVEVEILDFTLWIRQGRLPLGPDIYSRCASAILDASPQLVGFSAQSTTLPAVIRISRLLKEQDPALHVLLGGHSVSFVDTHLLRRYSCIDSVVRGEGEITFPEWVASRLSREEPDPVPGVTCRKGDRVLRGPERPLIEDLDTLPLPRYDLVPALEVYRDACNLPRSIAILEVGRGCPHRCVYCSESLLWRRRSRRFSVDRLLREMRRLHEGYGAECFLLAYDQFTASRRFVREFCDRVIEASLHRLPWYCISRLDSVDADLLGRMREAGCESMCYGIDSGSERTLAFIRKNIDPGILFTRVEETTQQGIVPTLSYVIGFPEEEKEDIDATLNLALRAGMLGNVNTLIQMPTVLSGTELHARYRSRLVRAVDTYFALGLEFDGKRRLASDEHLIDSDPELFSCFYNIPCPGRTLEELYLLAEYFPLVVDLFPKTFFLLVLETGRSESDLFLSWLEWLRDRMNSDRPGCTPEACSAFFPRFVEEVLPVDPRCLKRKHLPEVLRYEVRSQEAGAAGCAESAFHVDLRGHGRGGVVRSPGTVVEVFEYPMGEIVADLRSGKIREAYEPARTFLVFQRVERRLEVTEINDFGWEFLRLADAGRGLDEIAEALYPRYGEGMDRKEFFNSCREAVEIFTDMRILAPSRKTDMERR